MAGPKRHFIDFKRHLWYNGFSNKTGGRSLTCILTSFEENFLQRWVHRIEMHNGAGREKVMKPSRPISVLYRIALLAIITVTCNTACASLLELKSYRLGNEEQNVSVRPSELFAIDPCSRLRSGVSEQYQTQLSPPGIVCDYEVSGWQIHPAVESSRQYAGQSPPVVEPGFKRQAGMYRLGLLSVIYEKTLLRASYICSTSETVR